MRLLWICAALPAIAMTVACAGNDFDGEPSGPGGAGVGGTGGDGSGAGGQGAACEPGETASCYSGPVGTEGVGACMAGTQACKTDLSGFGACTGEVTPTVELCTTAEDDNCDGSTDDGPGGCPCMPGDSESCYSGPDGTSGVGICAAGTAACLEDGSGFGPCQGAVLPAVESCNQPGDEDCDGFSCSEPAWALLAGDLSGQTGTAIAFDSAGNIIVAGRFIGSIDLGGGDLISDGTFDMFVAKFDPVGTHLWSKAFGAAGDQFVTGVATVPPPPASPGDPDSIILTGYFNGAFSLGGPNLNSVGVFDGYVAKLSGLDGAHSWSSRFGDGGQTLPRALDVDIAGNTILVGDHGLPVGCGGATCSFNAFVRKYTPFGTPFYTVENPDAGDQRMRDVAVDPAGNAWVVGSYEGTLSFGASSVSSAGGTDVFASKFDSLGSHAQTLHFGNASSQEALSVDVDDTGGPLIGGSFLGALDFGGGNLVSAGDRDFFLVKLGAGGAHQWSQRFGDASTQFQVYVDYTGDAAVLSGNLLGSAHFGGQILTSAGSDDLFVASFDPQSGAHQWSKSFGDALAQRVRGLAVSADGAIGITGGVNGTIDFGLGPMTANGQEDAFVAVLQP